MTKTNKAIVEKINYAGLAFEGLMLPDGSYGIALSQANKIAQFADSPRHIKKVADRILGQGFQIPQTYEFTLGKISTEIQPRPQWVLTLQEFSMLTVVLMSEGNAEATKFVMASVTEKLERIFDNTFGVVVKERERELRFAARLSSKVSFRPLTDALKACGFDQKSPNPKKRYNVYIWEFQTALGIKSGTRDEINADELMRLVAVQSKLTGLIEAGVDPWDALESVIQSIKENKI